MTRAAAVLALVAAACGGGGDGTRPSPVPTGPRTPPPEACRGAATDTDRDGLSDACESLLATAFAPRLMFAADDCAGTVGPPAGGFLHGAEPRADTVRLVYLPAYFRDCGWRGPKCLLPGVDCTPHAGDSEFIVVDVAPADGGWTVEGVFLSAHCFGRSDGGCRWYRGEELARFAWAGGAPVVWVAAGRHANYPSRAACDRGHHRIDSCDDNTIGVTYPVAPERNIGSAARPLGEGTPAPGCLPGSAVGSPPAVAPEAVECFWVERRFGGWQREGEGATPYLRYLEEVAEYRRPEGPPEGAG